MADKDKMREEFEAWFESDAMPAESNWFLKDAEGGYAKDFVAHTYYGWQAAKESDRKELEELEANAQAEIDRLNAQVLDRDTALEAAKQRIAKLEDEVIDANTEQFVNLRAIAAEDACKIFKAEKEALENKMAAIGGNDLALAINALPERLRLFVHDLETNADPAGTVRELFFAKETLAGLETLISTKKAEELTKLLAAARKEGFEEGKPAGRDELRHEMEERSKQ